MKINGTVVNVLWEENESVDALMDMCKDAPLEIQMSMYGGFEQVGPLGRNLPRNDSQTTTSAGDIVLYSGDQIVVFYGSNSWSYTRLGHITDQDNEGMAALLGNGDVTITIGMEAQR
jgi:IMP dehydrogenase/GMP reductase